MKPTAIIYKSVSRRVPKLLKKLRNTRCGRIQNFKSYRGYVLVVTRSARGL